MGLRDRLSRARRGGGEPAVHVGDPRFDDWEVVRDFGDLDSAAAWRQHLDEAGVTAFVAHQLRQTGAFGIKVVNPGGERARQIGRAHV